MGILDGAPPNKRKDRTLAALMQLEPDDREQIVNEIQKPEDERGYTDVYLAERLTFHTSESVDGYSISRFRKKIKEGKVQF